MKLKAVRCLKCKDIIYSRARHDMRYCSCTAIAIDGGPHLTQESVRLLKGVDANYIRLSGDIDDREFVDIQITATIQDLYSDWTNGLNKYGLIKEGEHYGHA